MKQWIMKNRKLIFWSLVFLGCARGIYLHEKDEMEKKEKAAIPVIEINVSNTCIDPKFEFGCDSPILRLFLYHKFDNQIYFCHDWNETYNENHGVKECTDEQIDEIISFFERKMQ